MDQQSDYLIARYDGAVLDAKPWGRGALEAAPTAQALGYSGQQAVVLQELLRKEVDAFNLPRPPSSSADMPALASLPPPCT